MAVCGAGGVAGWPGVGDGRSAVYLCVWRGKRGKDEKACEHKSMVEISVLLAEGEG